MAVQSELQNRTLSNRFHIDELSAREETTAHFHYDGAPAFVKLLEPKYLLNMCVCCATSIWKKIEEQAPTFLVEFVSIFCLFRNFIFT